MGASADLHFATALLPTGWSENVRVTIHDGMISDVTSNAPPGPADERHAFGLPGVPNLHSHAFQRAIAGLTERRGPGSDSFWTWRDMMYRFVDRLNPDGLRAIATMAYVEMLEAGFTHVGEFHYLHHDPDGHPYDDPAATSEALIAAAADTGIGLTLLPVFYARSGFGGLAPSEGQRRFINDPEGFARLLEAARRHAKTLPGAIVGIAPHSLRAVTPEELEQIIPLAGDAPIHIHIAEQQREVDDCLAWSGARPVEWLLDHAPVGPDWCLVHATHMTEAETVAMARSGAVAGLCPITEANLGDGIFPAHAFVAAGGRFGIGSDSNVRIDMSEELRLLEYGQRLTLRSRNVLATPPSGSTGETIFSGAVQGGGQALGTVTGIAPGLPADFVSLDGEHRSFRSVGAEAALDMLIFAAGQDAIDCVWRRGKKLVSNGRHRLREAAGLEFQKAIRAIKHD